jgi:hypothetical protein
MRGLLMLSLGAAALGAVALVPVSAWAGRGHGGHGHGHGGHGHWHGGHGHWHGGHGHWRGGRGWGKGGWSWGWGPRVYVGPSYRRCWAPGYGWEPCRRWYY